MAPVGHPTIGDWAPLLGTFLCGTGGVPHGLPRGVGVWSRRGVRQGVATERCGLVPKRGEVSQNSLGRCEISSTGASNTGETWRDWRLGVVARAATWTGGC
jgi:hypothetical protein